MQRKNEMSCYEHSVLDIRQALKKNMGYLFSEQYRRIQQDIDAYLKTARKSPET